MDSKADDDTKLSHLIKSNRQLEMVSSDRSKLFRLLKRRGISEKEFLNLMTMNFADVSIPKPIAESNLHNVYALRRQSAKEINHFVTVISQITASDLLALVV